MKIACAMSGGVDSTLAAGLLARQGHDVIGITLKVWACSALDEIEDRPGVCCTPTDIIDAAESAARFGFPHYVYDIEKEFETAVIDQFCDDYTHGRTPNPCVRCNERIKYKTFLKRALELGCDAIATGHYAKRGFDEATGRHRLLRPRDKHKDQTYFLFPITQEQLARARFPLADMTKDQVRAGLREVGLIEMAEKEESQDICFVREGSYRDFVRARRPDSFRKGKIVSADGETLGEHDGVANFTIGQRRGVGVAAGRPLYVLNVLPEENLVVVGDDEDLWRDELTAHGCNWIPFERPPEKLRCAAKIRYRSDAAPCTVTADGNGGAHVAFAESQRAITPGQAIVFYNGDECLGGGWIE